MKTMVNGKDAEWTPEIWAKWHTFADDADPKYKDAPVSMSNYFTPRPYQDEYSRGSREEGFTYTRKREVYQVIVKRHSRVGGDV